MPLGKQVTAPLPNALFHLAKALVLKKVASGATN